MLSIICLIITVAHFANGCNNKNSFSTNSCSKTAVIGSMQINEITGDWYEVASFGQSINNCSRFYFEVDTSVNTALFTYISLKWVKIENR